MDPNQLPPSSASISSRKRSRENETPSQRHKREKAAERQRRKRERDRQAGLNNILSLAHVQQNVMPPQHQQQQPQQHQHPPLSTVSTATNASGIQETSVSAPAAVPDYGHNNHHLVNANSVANKSHHEDLSPDELSRRERVRAAARERQRKHRALVKQKKMRELGLDMGNEIMPGMEDVGYRINPEAPYQNMIPHEIPPPHHPHHPGLTHPQHPHQQPHAMHEPPFPQGQPLGGQTFASTLLLSFSCAPLLKQHLLRTLSMTNEELTSLEPIIAQAWDHWDQQVSTLSPSCMCFLRVGYLYSHFFFADRFSPAPCVSFTS